jgi:hypothetical protein
MAVPVYMLDRRSSFDHSLVKQKRFAPTGHFTLHHVETLIRVIHAHVHVSYIQAILTRNEPAAWAT